ncbi:MAG: hypothetical protein M9918_13335 [Anaerolineae bacterium]|nr:hypothetical protein [Anaerolineae bacterium]
MIYFTARGCSALPRALPLSCARAGRCGRKHGADDGPGLGGGRFDIPDELTDLDTAVTGAELDADHSKLAGIESGATADQTAGEIEAIVSHDNLVGFCRQ